MQKEVDLSGAWEAHPVKRFDGKYDVLHDWLPVQVPGHWQETPGLESYSGKMIYRRRFKYMPQEGKRVFLRTGGAFYRVAAYLNGSRLGASEGYFFPVEYEITGMLRKENSLLFEIECSNEAGLVAKTQLTGTFGHSDCLPPNANPGGIWLPVHILSSGPVRTDDQFFSTVYLGRGASYARITGRASVDGPPGRYLVRISFIPLTFEGEPQVFERRVYKTDMTRTYHYNLDLKDPVLWNTHDRGKPELYTLRLETEEEGSGVCSDRWECAFGVRTFEMRDYIGWLNGKRLFLRGANYPPCDLRPALMKAEDFERDAALVIEANLNFLRVHGHVEHPEFYRVCDERGILLWQDFPMQWSYEKGVADRASIQLEKMITHIGNHPSIGAWCMHSRAYRKAPGPGRPLKSLVALASKKLWNRNRDRMDRELAVKARFMDPQRFTAYCSGDKGLWRERGGAHIYYGWSGGRVDRLHKTYKKRRERLKFVTEFGAQSLPSRGSGYEFMSDSLETAGWTRLERERGLDRRLLKRVPPSECGSMEEYAAATQRFQGELIRYYADRIRALKYRPAGGMAAYMLHDPWPAVLCSVLDHGRRKKLSFESIKAAMSPVYVFGTLEPRYRRGSVAALPVLAVNDLDREVEFEARCKVISPVGDAVIQERVEIGLPADSEAIEIASVSLKLRWEGQYELSLEWEGPSGSGKNDYRFRVS